MLQAYGAVDISLAKNGNEAIAALETNCPDLVLCDYNLGDGRDGQQVLEEARHRDLLSSATVFVMVTAENTADMVMGSLECQPDGYLSKPVTKSTLQVRLRELLDRREALLPVHRAIDRSDPSTALSLCDEMIDAGSRYRLLLRHLKATLLLETGEFEALKTLCESILDERDVAWASYMLGKCYSGLGQHDLARQTYLETIELNSDFVGAYDALAETHLALGELEEAEQVLKRGVAKSPRSLPRQRALATAAEQMEHTDVALRARRDVVRTGTHSVLRQPRDHTAYARVLMSAERSKEAFAVVDSISKAYPRDRAATLEAEVCRAAINTKVGRDADAAQALHGALEIAEEAGEIGPELALDLIKVCLEGGEREAADKIAKQVVRNNHGETSLLEKVVAAYEETGAGGEGKQLVSDTKEQTAAINNEGVRLLKAGKIEESITFFADALQGMPQNPVVNLNAAYSVTLSMKSGRVSSRGLAQARGYLDAARAASADARGYQKVLRLYKSLSVAKAAS